MIGRLRATMEEISYAQRKAYYDKMNDNEECGIRNAELNGLKATTALSRRSRYCQLSTVNFLSPPVLDPQEIY